jgi:hypothetical protein
MGRRRNRGGKDRAGRVLVFSLLLLLGVLSVTGIDASVLLLHLAVFSASDNSNCCLYLYLGGRVPSDHKRGRMIKSVPHH